jgi:hypothetical protein
MPLRCLPARLRLDKRRFDLSALPVWLLNQACNPPAEAQAWLVLLPSEGNEERILAVVNICRELV